MSDSSYSNNTVPVIIIILMISALAFAVGYVGGRGDMQNAAVKANVAEWVGDEIGRPEFKWKTK